MRNMLLIALAFNATQEEIDAAHESIDLHFGGEAAPTTAPAPTTGLPIQTEGAATAPATATPPTAAGVTLDKNGLPWDERIHSSNKKMTDKGVWVARRNVPDATRDSVTAELRASMANAGPVANTAPPAAGLGAPPLPGGNLPPLPGAAVTDPAYAALVKLIGEHTASDANPAGRITADWLQKVLVHFGVTDGSLQTLAHTPALVPQIDTYVRQSLGL